MLRALRATPHLQRSFFTPHRRKMSSPSSLVNFINTTIRSYQGTPNPNYASYIRESRSKNLLIWTCIGANTIVWLYWTAATTLRSNSSSTAVRNAREAAEFLRQNFTLSVRNVREGRWWTTFTSAFSHVGFGHLVFNMIAFQQLGQILVYTPGFKAVRHFGALILGSALAGSAAFLSHEKTMRLGVVREGLGFSGVVSGVVTAAACMAPHQKMLLMGILPVPLWALGMGYIAYDTYMMEGDTSVGHDTHIGGAIFGGVFYMLTLRRFGGILGRRGRP
jgi:membrane associated rhomboid family serine protease